MRAALLAALAIGASAGWPPSLAGEGDGPPAPDALRERIAALEQTVRTLEGIVEGTAHPVNLGRTSLAAVDASSVNGDRALDSKYYGVVNAFDGGENWHRKINYTYWLTSGEASPWIEVRFERPLTVTSIAVDNGPVFSARLVFAKGGEEIRVAPTPPRELPRTLGPSQDRPRSAIALSPRNGLGHHRLSLAKPMHGVIKVRLTFRQSGPSNIRVNEVRVMGHIPPGVDYKVGRPRTLLTRRNVEAIARDAFGEWHHALRLNATSRVQEDEQTVTVTYSEAGLDLLRVTVRKHDGAITKEILAKLILVRPRPKQ